MISIRRNRGIAIITAMLLTAIISSVATGLAADNFLDLRRTQVMLFHEQGVQVAAGAESWVKIILRDDELQSQVDHLDELWASELPGLPVESDTMQGAVTGQLEDLQGRFNVNNLVDSQGVRSAPHIEQFQRLLAVLGLDSRLAGIAADWIDADQRPGSNSNPDGAEDPTYAARTPAYMTANQPLTSATELLAIEGMDKASYDLLAPHITALPRIGTRVNVNTATGPVLQSLGPNIDAGTAESLIEQRKGIGFTQPQVVFANLVDPKLSIDAIDEKTTYFRLKAIVQIDTVRVTYYSLLERTPGSGDVTVLVRSLGTE